MHVANDNYIKTFQNRLGKYLEIDHHRTFISRMWTYVQGKLHEQFLEEISFFFFSVTKLLSKGVFHSILHILSSCFLTCKLLTSVVP